MLNSPQVVPVTCSVCRKQFAAEVMSLIDVEQHPELKARLVGGRFNAYSCPHCGNEGILSAPFLYHDPAKELLFCFMPPEAGLTGPDQQKVIGDLTNALMNSLPPQKRKAYLFQPRVFLSLPSMIEDIMLADGVSKEMWEAQKARAALIEEMLACRDDEQLKQVIQRKDEHIDYEFLQTLTASAEASKAEGQEELSGRLLELRTKVLEWSAVGKTAAATQAVQETERAIAKDALLQRMIACQNDEELEALVAVGRPVIDYSFYQDLTNRIEAAQTEKEAQRLARLRDKILDISARQDEAARAALQQAADLLITILDSAAPEEVISERLTEIDQAFFAVLRANIHYAQAEGRVDVVERLKKVHDTTVRILQENAPPEIKLINRLMEADYPQETRRILQENTELLTEELTHTMAFVARDLEADGQLKVAHRLMDIRQQAVEVMEGQ